MKKQKTSNRKSIAVPAQETAAKAVPKPVHESALEADPRAFGGPASAEPRPVAADGVPLEYGGRRSEAVHEGDVLRLIQIHNQMNDLREQLCFLAENVVQRLHEKQCVRIGVHVVDRYLYKDHRTGIRSKTLVVNGVEVWREELRPVAP